MANYPNPKPILDYTPMRSIEAMDQAGVGKAIISSPVSFGDDPVTFRSDAISAVREINNYGAKLVTDYRGRFGFFAVLPLPDIDSSLREIEYAFDTLKADGVGILTSYGNHWLGDKAFQPVFDELNRRNAIVYSHPTDAPCCHNLIPDTGPQTVEWNTDTSRAIWSMINDGANAVAAGVLGVNASQVSMATRYRNIRFIWSHAGGSLVGLIGRFIGLSATADNLRRTPEPNSRLYHLRRFYYDTAGSANPIQMQALKALVGSSQIVFGSDFPFVPIKDVAESLLLCGLSAEDLRGISRENALTIKPTWS
jgi:predicted TIM-barrel fold metal-dependent hydrolase